MLIKEIEIDNRISFLAKFCTNVLHIQKSKRNGNENGNFLPKGHNYYPLTRLIGSAKFEFPASARCEHAGEPTHRTGICTVHMLRHIAHRAPESVSRISFSKRRVRTHTHVASWNQIIGPGSDSPWIARRANPAGCTLCASVGRRRRCGVRRRRHRHHRLRRLRRRCVVVVVDSVRVRASSVGQNGVNRPRAFKVISARSGFHRAAGPYTRDIRSCAFCGACSRLMHSVVHAPRTHLRFPCRELHELWGRNARRR